MRPHVLVLHAWGEPYAEYDSYIDHKRYAVSYICSEPAQATVPGGAAAVAITRLDDPAAVLCAARALIARLGNPERVVALREYELIAAGELRAEFGVPGDRPADLDRFRDKLIMGECVDAAGIPAPACAEAPDTPAILAFGEAHGWPVIVKPRLGASSRDVIRIDTPAQARSLTEPATEPRLVQSFCPDPILHIHGLWDGDRLDGWHAHRYLTNCLDFAGGRAMASVGIDDPGLRERIAAFTVAVCTALSPGEPRIFHLEAFLGRGPNGDARLRFLEIGARAGGAELPFLWREVYGADLLRAACDLQMGRPPRLGEPDTGRIAGFLLVPVPGRKPATVRHAELPPEVAHLPYWAGLPAPGSRIGGANYQDVGGRFRFAGNSSAEVEQAVLRTAAAYRLDCEPDEAPYRSTGSAAPIPQPA
ncbi:ATP-grasp domain-containing protein [Nocardia aurantia]|uniref:ATP-grasp domain-containing protein n=1 Tax=Nocardia aurantia TaxID=2585199 RepID=A0A7K0DR11_9NOCA|nr:hypothetical protein [Nocardia aurantia]MQY28225.1 hypothetical protein [Nocardia aurantia]